MLRKICRDDSTRQQSRARNLAGRLAAPNQRVE